MTQIEEAVKTLREARRKAEEAKREQELAEQEVIKLLEAEQRKTAEVQDGGKVYRATYVKNQRVEVNEEGLKKALGAETYNKLTTAKLDRKKLEAALKEQTVDAYVVGMHSAVADSKPYIRFSEGQAKDDHPTE